MKNRDLKNLSLPLNSNLPATVSGINRNSPSRASIKVVLPPVIPSPTKNGAAATAGSGFAERKARQVTCPEQHTVNYEANINDSYGKPYMQQIPEQCTISMFSSLPEQQSNHYEERISPGSSVDQLKFNRYSSASLDSGRGSDSIKLPSSQSNRVSVHSCESIGSTSSNKDSETSQQSSSLSSSSSTSSSFCSSSSSSSSSSYQNQQYYNRQLSSSSSGGNSHVNCLTPTGMADNNSSVYGKCKSFSMASNSDSSNENSHSGSTPFGQLGIAEMVLHGVSDDEIKHLWLKKMNMSHYEKNFVDAGYDMETISRMTPQDLIAIGITDPSDRSKLTSNIKKLNIPKKHNNGHRTLEEWLRSLNLECYYSSLLQQGYNTIDRVTELTWEDLEDVGIDKLGHQKKLLLAIKKWKDNCKSENGATNNAATNPTYSVLPPPVNEPPSSVPMAFPLENTFQQKAKVVISANPQAIPYQNVPIKMYANSKLNSPTNPDQPFESCSIIAHSNVAPSTLFQAKPQMRTFQMSDGGGQFTPPVINGFNYNNQPYVPPLCSRGKSLESLDHMESGAYLHNGPQFNNLPNYPNPALFKHSLQHSSGDLYNMNRQTIWYDQNYATMNGSSNQFPNYDFDGTATLNRPKNLFKNKPVAKIIASSRQQEVYDNYDSSSIKSTDSNEKFFQDSSSDSSSIYSSLKKKPPPPPPKRVNSIRKPNSMPSTPAHETNGSFDNNPIYSNTPRLSNGFYNEMDSFGKYNSLASEDVFASCVKNLTTRFSEMHSLNSIDDMSNGNIKPSSIPQMYTLPLNKKDSKLAMDNCSDSVAISSSSSTESMPFANDNVGTIRQKSSNFLQQALKYADSNSKPSSSSSSSTSSPSYSRSITEPAINSPTVANSNTGTPLVNAADNHNQSNQRNVVVNSLEHIELMLANIKTQLDSID